MYIARWSESESKSREKVQKLGVLPTTSNFFYNYHNIPLHPDDVDITLLRNVGKYLPASRHGVNIPDNLVL